MEYCAEIQKTGSYKVIEINEEKLESPGPDDVLLRHKAIGLNYIDVYYRNGIYPMASLPGKLGHEASGVVEAVGKNVKSFKEGDRVAYASATPGAYCSARIISSEFLVKIPKEIDFEVAAAMMLKGMTVHYLFKRTANLQDFHKILFHAAGGGVGLIAMQWAKMIGVETIGTVSSEEKRELARNYGATHTINYVRENFVEEVRTITDGEGVDVVFDSIGAQTFYQSLQCLRKYGLMVSFGNASGKVASFDLGLLSGHLFITRPSLWPYISARRELELTASEIVQLVALKKLRIPVYQKYSLHEAGKAHRDLEERRTTGCSILIP